MIRNFFLLASLVFFACFGDSSHNDILDGSNYDVSEKEDCNGIEYNPKIQFCSQGIIKDKGEFIDERDGKKYRYIEIGTQIWMAENLNYETAGSRCYDNNLINCEKCGRLYSWFTATTKEICPEGWHLPDNDDWETLIIAAAGGSLRAKNDWELCSWPNYSCTDDYGFSFLACGEATDIGSKAGETYGFKSIGRSGYIWSSTESSYGAYNFASGLNFAGHKYTLISVRCVKN